MVDMDIGQWVGQWHGPARPGLVRRVVLAGLVQAGLVGVAGLGMDGSTLGMASLAEDNSTLALVVPVVLGVLVERAEPELDVLA